MYPIYSCSQASVIQLARKGNSRKLENDHEQTVSHWWPTSRAEKFLKVRSLRVRTTRISNDPSSREQISDWQTEKDLRAHSRPHGLVHHSCITCSDSILPPYAHLPAVCVTIKWNFLRRPHPHQGSRVLQCPRIMRGRKKITRIWRAPFISLSATQAHGK